MLPTCHQNVRQCSYFRASTVLAFVVVDHETAQESLLSEQEVYVVRLCCFYWNSASDTDYFYQLDWAPRSSCDPGNKVVANRRCSKTVLVEDWGRAFDCVPVLDDYCPESPDRSLFICCHLHCQIVTYQFPTTTKVSSMVAPPFSFTIISIKNIPFQWQKVTINDKRVIGMPRQPARLTRFK